MLIVPTLVVEFLQYMLVPSHAHICSFKLQHTQCTAQANKCDGSCRWLGVDKVFLRENAAQVPTSLSQRLAPFVESGFLDLGALPGAKHPLQNRWYNRCSKPDMAGMHSWVAFIDLDEFMVVLDKCALLRRLYNGISTVRIGYSLRAWDMHILQQEAVVIFCGDAGVWQRKPQI